MQLLQSQNKNLTISNRHLVEKCRIGASNDDPTLEIRIGNTIYKLISIAWYSWYRDKSLRLEVLQGILSPNFKNSKIHKKLQIGFFKIL